LLFSFLILATINKDLVICKKIVVSSVSNQTLNIKDTPTCHFEIKNKNTTPACNNGFIQNADENKCRFKDGTPNGSYDLNNRNGMVNNCCCPNSVRLNKSNFCNDKNWECKNNLDWRGTNKNTSWFLESANTGIFPC